MKKKKINTEKSQQTTESMASLYSACKKLMSEEKKIHADLVENEQISNLLLQLHTSI